MSGVVKENYKIVADKIRDKIEKQGEFLCYEYNNAESGCCCAIGLMYHHENGDPGTIRDRLEKLYHESDGDIPDFEESLNMVSVDNLLLYVPIECFGYDPELHGPFDLYSEFLDEVQDVNDNMHVYAMGGNLFIDMLDKFHGALLSWIEHTVVKDRINGS